MTIARTPVPRLRWRHSIGILCFGAALLASLIPSSEGWRRMELASHVLVLGACLAFPGGHKPAKGWTWLTASWGTFGFTLFVSSALTTETAMEFAQVLRKIWVAPALLFYASIQCYRLSPRIWWCCLGAFAVLSVGLMAYSVASTPSGIYVPSLGRWTGGGARLYLHALDSGIPLIGTAVVAYAFPGAAFIAATLCLQGRVLLVTAAAAFVGYVAVSIATGTRTGVFAALIAATAAMVVHGIRGRKILPVLGAIGVVVLVSSLAIVLSDGRLGGGNAVDRFSLTQLSDSTLTGRTVIWEERLQSIAGNPFGVGYFNSTANQFDSLSSHNVYIEALYSFGWLAGACFIAVLLALLVFSYRSAMVNRDYRKVIPMVFLTTMVIAYGGMDAVFVSSLFMYYSAAVFFGGCVACAASESPRGAARSSIGLRQRGSRRVTHAKHG